MTLALFNAQKSDRHVLGENTQRIQTSAINCVLSCNVNSVARFYCVSCFSPLAVCTIVSFFVFFDVRLSRLNKDYLLTYCSLSWKIGLRRLWIERVQRSRTAWSILRWPHQFTSILNLLRHSSCWALNCDELAKNVNMKDPFARNNQNAIWREMVQQWCAWKRDLLVAIETDLWGDVATVSRTHVVRIMTVRTIRRQSAVCVCRRKHQPLHTAARQTASLIIFTVWQRTCWCSHTLNANYRYFVSILRQILV